LLVNVILNQ